MATRQSAIVVGVVAIAGAIGGAGNGFGGIVAGLLAAFIGWLIFAGLTYFFGTQLFGTPTTSTTFEAVLRTLGYARVPGVLSVVGFIPVIGWIVAFIGSIWALVTAVIAIRQSLNVSTGRAIITAIIAGIASALVIGIVGLIFGIGFNIV